MDARLPCSWVSPGKDAGVGSLSLLQGIFLTQGWNPGLPHCRQIPYQLSHREAQPQPWLPTLSWFSVKLRLWAQGCRLGPQVKSTCPGCSRSPGHPDLRGLGSGQWALGLACPPLLGDWTSRLTHLGRRPPTHLLVRLQACSKEGLAGITHTPLGHPYRTPETEKSVPRGPQRSVAGLVLSQQMQKEWMSEWRLNEWKRPGALGKAACAVPMGSQGGALKGPQFKVNLRLYRGGWWEWQSELSHAQPWWRPRRAVVWWFRP